jgi:hypothetical protein
MTSTAHPIPPELLAHVDALCATDGSPFAQAFRATCAELDRVDAITLHTLRGAR